MAYFTYILCSRSKNALYIGVTSDLRRRLEEHRSGAGSVHTAKYRIHLLVYFEIHERFEDALLRERRIKGWRRAWKDELIRKHNPTWADVSRDIPL